MSPFDNPPKFYFVEHYPKESDCIAYSHCDETLYDDYYSALNAGIKYSIEHILFDEQK